MGKVFLTVGGGYDPLAGGSKSSSAASIKGQPWREWPEAAGVGAGERTGVHWAVEGLERGPLGGMLTKAWHLKAQAPKSGFKL